MRILIADESAARSKGLRDFFKRKLAGRKAKASHRSSALKADELVISCTPANDKLDECACHGLDLADQPEQAAGIFDALGIALLNRGCREEGGKLIEQALRIRRKLYGDDHPVTAQSLHSYARLLRERGELSAAEQTADVALRINQAAAQLSSLPVAVSLYELGVVYLNQGRFAEALAAAEQGLQILETLELEDTDPYTTRLMDVQARAEAGVGSLDKADVTFKALLKIDKAQVGPDHPKYATHLGNHASVREQLGQVRQAESDYRKVIDVYAKGLNRSCHPNLIDTYANLGSLLRARHTGTDLREAGGYFREALRLGVRVRGRTHPLVAIDHDNLGRWQYDNDDRKGALTSFTTALQILERNLKRKQIPENYVFIAETLTWSGRVLVESGNARDAARARPLLERALTVWSGQSQAEPLGKAVAQALLGRALSLTGGDIAHARELLEAAYPVLEENISGKDAFLARVRAWLGELPASTRSS